MIPSKTALLLLLLLISPFASPGQPLATIDLSNEQWNTGQHFDLAGDWSFSWQQWVDPTAPLADITWNRMSVPGAWNKQRETDNPYYGEGYASYALRVVVPSDVRIIYLSLPDMASAYELWINAEQLAHNGVIGKERNSETPAYQPKVIQAHPKSGVVDILIHTSNHHYQWGGIWYTPTITDDSGVFTMRELPLIKASIAATILISTALLSMALFLSRRKDKKVLYFSLLCFAVGIRRLVIDERLLYQLDSLDWHMLQGIENLVIYLLLPLFSSYFHHWFPKEVSRKLILVSWLICTPFCLAALMLDVRDYTQLNIPFQIALLVTLPYIFFAYAKALVTKQPGAKMFGLSLSVFAACVVNDILNYSYIINTPTMIHYGALAFVLFQLTALVRRYLINFKTIEVMSNELRQHNNELVKLDEYKDEFLATTSHELRTPLHGISELALRLKDNTTSFSESQKHQLNLIESSAKRLGSLVNDILDYSSIKHGKLSLKVSPTLLNPIAESVVQTLRPLAEGKTLTIECQLDDRIEYVMADEYRLQQILFNLLGNAIKFTESGYVRVLSERAGMQARIFIEDTGSGIPEDEIDILFQPFEKYVEGEHQHHLSTGLGLSISRQLVQLQSGELKLTSIVGKGSRAEFTLPIASAGDRTTAPSPSALMQINEGKTIETNSEIVSSLASNALSDMNRKPPNLAQQSAADMSAFYVPADRSALIYYADDEAVNREIVKSLLEKAGYTVKTFTNAQSLLGAIEQSTPELILLDLMMPGMSGLEACRNVREQHDCHALPVMMLTARYQISDIVDALGSGANDYLVKPYHENELLARVYSQLSVHRLWSASLENKALKSEIDRRGQKEAELTNTNTRLQHALNATDQGLLLLNEELDIVFANQQSCESLGQDTSELLGTPLSDLITSDSQLAFEEFSNSNHKETEIHVHLPHSNGSLRMSIRSFDEDTYIAVVLDDNAKPQQTHKLLQELTLELAQNRQRIDQVELALSQVSRNELSTRYASNSNDTSLSEESAKELVVKTLRSALSHWERYTQLSKADLAEQSKCWRVYIDGTTAKTRTLDKYLTVKSLPSKPRWRAVIQTANYVIDHCELSQEDHKELLDLIGALDLAYS